MAAEQRFVISARVIGAVRRDAPKLKTFMMSVLWSDASEVIIYRSFKEFKKFHRQLKKRFPLLNPFRKSDRVIPKFNGKARRSSLKQKGSQRSVNRMKLLENYCNKLLKCEQTVTQSSEATQFFTPKAHDLDQDFTKNSFMILLSENQPDGSSGGGWGVTHQHGASITHPFVTTTYRCVAAYETKDTKNQPFKVNVDEKVDVLIKDPSGWWLVENESRRLAWFPAPYLETLDGEDDDDDEEYPVRGNLYCAVRSYSTKKSDEVSVPIGSVVEVLRKSDDGWWLVRFNGKAGYIPSMYLQQYHNPRMGFFSMQSKLHGSSLNLGTGRELESPRPLSVSKAAESESGSEARSRSGTPVPERLLRAQSLNVLSETWLQTQAAGSAGGSGGRARSMSNTSAESSLSDFSSSSGSSSSLRDEVQAQSGAADTRRNADSGCGSFASGFSDRGSDRSSRRSGSLKVTEAAPAAPRVPPRPKTQEILTRCTSMTRKAALATKSRVQNQAELIQTR